MCTVVIPEDEFLIAERIRHLLERAGYCVAGATANANDMLALAERHCPAVAILDVRLAGALDGTTLAGHLDKYYGAQIIFVTGDPLFACRQTDNRGYQLLAKPFSDAELLQAVATACAIHEHKTVKPKRARSG